MNNTNYNYTLDCPPGTSGFRFTAVIDGMPVELGDCKPCLPGTYSDKKGMLECTSCPRGSYLKTPGAKAISACKPCPVGYEAPTGVPITIFINRSLHYIYFFNCMMSPKTPAFAKPLADLPGIPGSFP